MGVDRQPADPGSGLRLVAIKNHTYYPWLRQLNDQASQRGVTSTPTIYVNGVKLADDSPSGLTAAVNSHP
jgi:protein-disulfide isomerase